MGEFSKVYKPYSFYKEFNVKGERYFHVKPDECWICGHKKIGYIELIGVQTGAIFWECDLCSARFLRYPPDDTRHMLKEAEKLFYDLENLGNIHLELPN
mgnify:FL=1